MKKCTICKNDLDFSLFGKDRSRGDGLSAKCKDCAKLMTQSRKDKDPELFRQKATDHMRKHRSKQDKTDLRATWREQRASRRAKQKLATPPWLTDPQKAHIKRTYDLAALMEEITGNKYHVDHIIPLKGENVSGLHVPWNLQVLPADINLQKGNRTPIT